MVSSCDNVDDNSICSGISWGANSFGGNSIGSANSLNSTSGGVSSIRKVKIMKEGSCEIPSSNTLEFIEISIASTKREINKLRTLAGENASVTQKKILRSLKQKLKDLNLMLDSTKAQRSVGVPQHAGYKSKKAPFSSSGKREFQVKNVISPTPHFYVSQKDWNFGSDSGDRTIKMDSFSYSDRYNLELDLERFTKLDVLVGENRPHSRCKSTDFFGPVSNSIIKSRCFSPIAVPKLKEK